MKYYHVRVETVKLFRKESFGSLNLDHLDPPVKTASYKSHFLFVTDFSTVKYIGWMGFPGSGSICIASSVVHAPHTLLMLSLSNTVSRKGNI